MNLSAIFIHRRVMTTFIMLTIVLTGWIAFFKLSVSDIPTIEYSNIEVYTAYDGANSDIVLNQITIPLEKELAHIKGITEMTSTSSIGSSSIELSFDFSKDMKEAAGEVQEAINRAEFFLPKELDSRPFYHVQKNSQKPIMWVLLISDNFSTEELRDFADSYVIPRLSRIEGIARVRPFGSNNSIRLRLNPDLMAARQIGFNEVINAVQQHTTQLPLGTIQTGNKNLSIELLGNIQKPKDLENIKIGNNHVRIKDIGEISQESTEKRHYHFVTQDKTSEALILGIQKGSDANTVAISREVQSVISILNKEIPSSIRLSVWFDKAVWINASIQDVQWSLIFAFALVVLVIYFSLGRISESLITSLSLPLSLLGTFVIMYLAHFSLDLLTLLALTLSVGFVVDDAIVVLENIVRHHDQGLSAEKASLIGSKQICLTIFSMTLSLVAVFIPLIFTSGINGQLFRQFSMTLSTAILVSGFISLTLIPMLCSRFLSPHKKHNNFQQRILSINSQLIKFYGKTLKYCFLFPKTIICIAIFCMLATVPLFTRLPVNLAPSEDRGLLIASVRLPSGTEHIQINQQQKRLESLVLNTPSIDNFLCLNLDGDLLFLIRLLPLADRPPQEHIIKDLQKTMDDIPGTQTFIRAYQLIDLNFNMNNSGEYSLVVQGQNLTDVENAASEVTTALKSHPKFSFVENAIDHADPILAMRVNEELAYTLGLDKQLIQEVVQYAFGKTPIGTLKHGPIQEKIYMELLPQYNNHVKAPANLYLKTTNESFIPLKAIVDWEEKGCIIH